MARTVKPGKPEEIKAQQFKVTTPDFSGFEEAGDAEIKAANQNFKLYAEALTANEANKIYEQFSDDPIQLANALSKVPEMLKDLPDEVAADAKKKLNLNSIAMIQKAETNRQAKDEKEAKINAERLAENTGQNIADNYFNLLTYLTAPDEDKRLVDVEIYAINRAGLADMADMRDAKGKYIFSEKERASMKMPSEAMLEGFKQFIYRPELEQLQEWDKSVFANRDKFIRDTGIDNKTYDSMESALKARIKALQDDKTREIHGQAFYDAAELITQPIQDNIDKVKKDGIVSPKVVDKLVKVSKEATQTTYSYDPNRQTSPGALIESLHYFSDVMANNDWSYEGREKALSQASDAIMKLTATAKATNMSPELRESVLTSIKDALRDKQSADALAPVFDSVVNIYPMIDPISKDSFTEAYSKFGERQQQAKDAMLKGPDAFGGWAGAKRIATKNFDVNLFKTLNSYIVGRANGDLTEYYNDVANLDRQFKRDLVGFMKFSPTQWNNWEKDVENGKDVVIEYMGKRYRFNGFDAQNPFTMLSK